MSYLPPSIHSASSGCWGLARHPSGKNNIFFSWPNGTTEAIFRIFGTELKLSSLIKYFLSFVFLFSLRLLSSHCQLSSPWNAGSSHKVKEGLQLAEGCVGSHRVRREQRMPTDLTQCQYWSAPAKRALARIIQNLLIKCRGWSRLDSRRAGPAASCTRSGRTPPLSEAKLALKLGTVAAAGALRAASHQHDGAAHGRHSQISDMSASTARRLAELLLVSDVDDVSECGGRAAVSPGSEHRDSQPRGRQQHPPVRARL